MGYEPLYHALVKGTRFFFFLLLLLLLLLFFFFGGGGVLILIFICLGAFLIKQLFHSCLLHMR